VFAELLSSSLALPQKFLSKELRSGSYHIKLLFTFDQYENFS